MGSAVIFNGSNAKMLPSGNLLDSSGATYARGLSVVYQTSSATAAAYTSYQCNTTSAAFTMTLPAGAAGSVIRFVDDAGTWATHNLTIAPAATQTIQGIAGSGSLVCDLSGAFIQLSWDATNSYWVVESSGFQYGPAASTSQAGILQLKAPTQSIKTSGSAASYTPPAGTLWLRVRMVGGGGGGSSDASTFNVTSGSGAATTLADSGSISLSAGGGGGASATPGAGGTCSGLGTLGQGWTGAAGGFGTLYVGGTAQRFAGGMGGSSTFGGAGNGGNSTGTGAGGNASTNTGSGGGGGGTAGSGSDTAGAGGGAGGYIDVILTSWTAPFTYTVGSKGTHGALNTGGSYAGGDGADGIIVIEEHYY